MITLLARTCRGVFYDFYFFSHRRSHYFKLLSATRLVFTVPMSFTGSYTKDELNFPWQNNLILQKKVSGIDKVGNFKDFSRPNKEISTFQGPKLNSRTFQDN